MRIQTFSIVTGSEACNARCPFCISKMTPSHGMKLREPEVNWRNFRIACRFAKHSGATTAMLTGKGEPTLFPDAISRYLRELSNFEFPFIELQTNGIKIAEGEEEYSTYLKEWFDRGMTFIALSVVHFEPEKNRQIYLPHRESYIDLPQLIELIHSHGFSLRLICVLSRDFVHTREDIENMIRFAREHQVEQLTLTPVTKPRDLTRHSEIWEWTNKHHIPDAELEEIKSYLYDEGTPLMRLLHGAVVFDVGGQNVCLNNCLTVQADSEDLRNLIFFSDGHLRYYWQYSGAILL